MYDSSYDVSVHGYNYRLDDLRAALGRVQLRKLVKHNAQRKALAMCYRKELEELDGWIVPFRNYKGDSAYHLMGIVAPDRASRSGLVSALNKEGVQTSQHYPCITQLHTFASSKTRFDLPLSVSFGKRIITLPLFPSMAEDDVKSICRIIRDTTRRH
jgi:dTDP-4-amino-4,6-dideoxygalactose transaminase